MLNMIYPVDHGSPNYGPWAKSDPRSHFVNSEKIIYLRKFVDLLKYNISRNNHIT